MRYINGSLWSVCKNYLKLYNRGYGGNMSIYFLFYTLQMAGFFIHMLRSNIQYFLGKRTHHQRLKGFYFLGGNEQRQGVRPMTISVTCVGWLHPCQNVWPDTRSVTSFSSQDAITPLHHQSCITRALFLSCLCVKLWGFSHELVSLHYLSLM